jgi:RND family efflux transporter MFP subunit
MKIGDAKMRSFASLARALLTLVVVLVAIVVGWQLWSYYMLEPWTRDGRVRADVVAVAADVSGLVSDVFVHDNEKVSKGQQLFRIDQRRFQYALVQAEAQLAHDQAVLQEAQRNLARFQSLAIRNSIAQQQVDDQTYLVGQDKAIVALDQAKVDAARLDLERSTVMAPVDGIVTNFDLLPGRYVNAGAAVFALIDSHSFRVEGYFEETKLRRIRVGEDAAVKLIGDSRVLSGHVESVAYGIEDQNRSTSSDLLASVNPTFSWVRLAQRVPVRIKLDDVPPGLLLVAGRTATVSIGRIRWW